jgi:cytochrome P450
MKGPIRVPGGDSRAISAVSSVVRRIPGPSYLQSTRNLGVSPFRRLPEYLPRIVEAYGNIVAFRVAARRFVLLNDPEHIKEMLVTQQHAFIKSFGARRLGMVLGSGLLTSEEPHHRQMRRIVQPAFHRERIAEYVRTMETLTNEWVAKRASGERFDMHAAMNALTLRIVSTTLLGADTGAEADEVRQALTDTMDTYPSSLGPLGPLMRKIPFLPETKRFENARNRLSRVIYRLIAERRGDPRPRSDALSMLLEAEDPETGYRLTDEQVRDEALTLFLAGHETTANALVWTWYLLSQNPAVGSRLHEEARSADSREYATRVIRESMRLFPPAWIIAREATRDVDLSGGYRIAKGTTVFVCQLVLHRRADFYPDPNRFDPDRWLDLSLPQFAYAPFGGGARRCIGEEFAWSEAALLLSTIAREFRFTLEPDAIVEADPTVTLRPKHPIWMRSLS